MRAPPISSSSSSSSPVSSSYSSSTAPLRRGDEAAEPRRRRRGGSNTDALWLPGLLFCLAALLPIADASVLTFQVEPRTMDCVYEIVEQGKHFNMDFEVARGGLLDIKVKVFSPRGDVIVDKMAFFNHDDDRKLEEEGNIQFVALASGEHKICFDNTMSRWTAKVVSMLIPTESKKGHENIAKLEHLGPVVDSIIKIADNLDAVTRTQHHMAIRERSHQDTQLSTNSRVHWMAAFESCVLIGMTMFQLYYVRSWLSTKGPRRRRV